MAEFGRRAFPFPLRPFSTSRWTSFLFPHLRCLRQSPTDPHTSLTSQDPLTWTIQSSQSPEAEAFVLLLQAAWRDYVAASFEQTFSDIAGAVESSM